MSDPLSSPPRSPARPAPPELIAPPTATDNERAVLGSILLNREAIIAVAAWLRPEHFYLARHARIYDAMLAVYTRRVPPDTRTVADELRRRNRLDEIGGVVFLSDLVTTCRHPTTSASTPSRSCAPPRCAI